MCGPSPGRGKNKKTREIRIGRIPVNAHVIPSAHVFEECCKIFKKPVW